MKRIPAALTLALAALLGACASQPPASAPSAALDCTAVQDEIRAASEARHVAEQQQKDAWKAVVPFAVLARYGQGKSAVEAADQRLAELQQQAALRGCVLP
jgi:hypothetical protein